MDLKNLTDEELESVWVSELNRLADTTEIPAQFFSVDNFVIATAISHERLIRMFIRLGYLFRDGSNREILTLRPDGNCVETGLPPL